jgi:sulfonate transport system substrate-binding protein
MKKLLAVIFALTIVLSVFSGCSKKSEPIRIGVLAATAGVPVQYAQDKGFFKAEGVEVKIEVFQTGAPINEAIAAGQLDMALSGAASIFSLANGTCTLLAETTQAGGEGMYVRADSDLLQYKGEIEGKPNVYGTASAIKGKKFLVQLGVSSQLNAQKYCELFGLKEGDYELIHMDPGPAYQAFISGEADVLVTFPPYSFQALAAGAVELCSFEDAVGFTVSSACFATNQLVKERRGELVKIMKAIMKAQSELQDDSVRSPFAMQYYANNGRTYTQQTMDDEMAVAKYRYIPEFTDDNYFFGKCFVDQEDFYYKNGKIEENKLGNIKKSLDPSILNEALGINVKVAD